MSASTPDSIVFGASGVVGCAIVRELSKSSTGGSTGNVVTAVSRSGSIPSLADLPGVSFQAGDALDEERTLELCQGCRVIYCSIGLPYISSIWERDFPVIVESMLKAAQATGAVLIWVDNLYMFGPEAATSGVPMKESARDFTEYGRKPALRARMDNTMLAAAESGRCKVAIVRASDFYGPGVKNSALGETFMPKIINGSRPMVLGDTKTKHTYTYVPDLARATVAVANAGESAWGRAWHCPNAPATATDDIAQRVATICGKDKALKPFVLKGIFRFFLGLFIVPLREMPEMSFLWNDDYLVDHSEFLAKFPEIVPTPLDEGLRETVEWWRAQEK